MSPPTLLEHLSMDQRFWVFSAAKKVSYNENDDDDGKREPMDFSMNIRISSIDFIGPGDKNKKTRQTKSSNPPPSAPSSAETKVTTRPPPRKRKEQSVPILSDFSFHRFVLFEQPDQS